MLTKDLPVFEFHQGTEPLLISMPHSGTQVPADIAAGFTAQGLVLADTDWHIPCLYEHAKALGASILQANYSRYVVDMNRPPNNASLYPGQSVPGLCPVDTFHDEPIYQSGKAPSEAEIEQRKQLFWQPYHQQIERELQRLKSLFGCAVLWDAHSIRSHVPRFFEGKLPDLNFGTDGGRTCDLGLMQELSNLAASQPFTHVVNGRFKGGYITRHYGQPEMGIHAVQLEMAQSCYMDEQAFAYLPDKAEQIQPLITRLLEAAIRFARSA
ncbi:N-formylglutamate deformylase [Pseudomonas sp. F1_0610]|uniref:N-formylglutamate deformylase n=1 Tax=Pseudomonas sp. F1_0610 TaxID=3114284 RepID=UPI0039C318DD